jgi:hypothetical protein
MELSFVVSLPVAMRHLQRLLTEQP